MISKTLTYLTTLGALLSVDQTTTFAGASYHDDGLAMPYVHPDDHSRFLKQIGPVLADVLRLSLRPLKTFRACALAAQIHCVFMIHTIS